MRKKRIITLLTDFGLKDPFVGTMKGVIYSINPDAQIVDLTHEISPQDVFEGAFNLCQAYRFFPAGTIHIAVVDPGVGGERKSLVIDTGKFIFVAPDNGIASLAAGKEHKNPEVFEINNEKYFLKDVSCTFHGRDIFAPVGAFLSKGVKPKKIGPRINEYKKIDIPEIKTEGKRAEASVIHIDKFGNAVTNIDTSLTNSIARLHVKENTIEKISKSYEEGCSGETIAIPGSTGFLEISVNKQNAAEILGIGKGEKIVLDLDQ